MKVATNVMFTQMSANDVIKKFGEKAVEAMVKEYRKIDKGPMEGKPFVTTIYPDKLYLEDKRKALEAVNLIKEKRHLEIKGRTCADGRKKKYLKEGESVSSPTVYLEVLLCTLIIDAHKG